MQHLKRKQRLQILTIITLTLTACGESESARREREAEHAQRLAQIEIEKAREMAKLKIEAEEAAEESRRQRAEEEQRRLRAQQAEEQRRMRAQQEEQANRYQQAKLKLVNELTFTTRISLLDENDKVLQIRNPNPQSIDIYVKCYAQNGYSRTIFVSVPALQTAELGILEGWNFRSGERFEVIYDDTIVHRYNIP